MAELPARKVSLKNVIIDGVLTAGAFLFFYEIAKIHVPSNDPVQVGLWSAFTATCMSGVFWLAWQMFKSVYRHQRENARNGQ